MATGFKELVLVRVLKEQGLSVLKSRAVVDTVFESIKDALGRHEDVELPIGTFTVLQNPDERRAWKFGQITTLYAHRYKVKFLPSAELNLAAAAAPPSPPRPTRKKEIVKSDLTISAELISDFIRANVYDRNLFFAELHNGPSIPALFEHVQPKPHEFRTLDEAAQVIEECKPPQMPEDPWEHLYACLEWFARWTQRVIPKVVWKEAMQQAKQTLLPQDPIRTLDGR
jgi:nucleoid DNA-binding protein